MESIDQALLFDKDKWNTAKARRWMKKHHYQPIKRAHVTENKIRYRLSPPEKDAEYRTISIGRGTGIQMVIKF